MIKIVPKWKSRLRTILLKFVIKIYKINIGFRKILQTKNKVYFCTLRSYLDVLRFQDYTHIFSTKKCSIDNFVTFFFEWKSWKYIFENHLIIGFEHDKHLKCYPTFYKNIYFTILDILYPKFYNFFLYVIFMAATQTKCALQKYKLDFIHYFFPSTRAKI